MARGAFDQGHVLDLAFADLDVLVAQAAAGRKDIAFKAADELVVVGHRGFEPAAHALEVVGGDGQAIVKLAAHLADFARFAGQAILAPDLGNGPRDRDKIGRAGQKHAAIEREIPQAGIVFERGGDEVFARHEHQHIVGRIVELALVRFAAQSLDVVAH